MMKDPVSARHVHPSASSNAPPTYAFPPGGMPDPSEDPTGTAVFTPAYAVLPAN